MAKKRSEAPAAEHTIGLKGEPKEAVLKVKDMVRVKDLQIRSDADKTNDENETDGTFILERAVRFAECMKAGDVFPPVKVMKIVASGPDDKNQNVGKYLIWDGMNTHRGAELAHVKELPALVWEGTAFDALHAAATVANREHDKAGKVLTNKDKERALTQLALSYVKSGIPKSEWPSNREAAEKVGCSRGLVNTMDPFGRAGGDRRAEINAKKREGAKRETPPPGGPVKPPTPLPCDPVTGNPATHAIKDRSGKVVATYEATSPADALKRHADESQAEEADFTVEPIAQAPPAGSPVGKSGLFDWAKMDESLGWVSRAVPTMAETYGLTRDAAFKEFERNFEVACRYIQDTRASVSKAKGKKK